MVIISENLSPDKISPIRTVKIANARNRVLEEIKHLKYKDYEFFIMADLDFRHSFPINAIVKTIRDPAADWDCVSSNGIQRSNEFYWDRYAYRSKEYPLGPELLGDRYWHDLFANKTWFSLRQTKWERVWSGFGGLAIYRTSVLKQFSYSGIVTKDLEKYYEIILNSIDKDNEQLQKYCEKISFDRYQNLKIPVIFCQNTLDWQRPDKHSISCCEHLTLHASMALNGYDKFYINPQLILQY